MAKWHRLKVGSLTNADNYAEKRCMSLIYEEESYKIRKACFKVWKKLGGAFKENVVQNSLTIELEAQHLKLEKQKRISVYYEGKKVGIYVPDLIVEEKILIELKAKPYLTLEDIKQFWYYLKASPYKLGFLINFGNKLEIKRRVYDTARDKIPRTSASLSAYKSAI